MLKTCVAAFFTLAIVLTLAPQPVMAQSAGGGMRTPDGQPDVSGVFTFRTLTPLQAAHPVRGKRDPDRRGGRRVRSVGTPAPES